MKKIFVIGLSLIAGLALGQNNTQKSDDAGRIALATVVPSQIEEMPPSARDVLENKLNQITAKNGLGASSLNNRFIITANVNVLTKDITATAPPMHALTLEITLFIGDGIDGTLFSSTSLSYKGVGANETKAYLAALKNLKPDDVRFQNFINTGKDKIIAFYNSKCDFILKEAEMLVSQNEFDAAISKLVGIPEVCKECYDKAMDAVAPIYQKQIDRECKILLADAQGTWNSSQNLDGASSASMYLGQIDPNASCYEDAKKLSASIAKRVKELDQREWDFKMKQQQDNVEIRKATIKAARDIGVAYGNNQPKSVTYNYRGWW
ncbi:MAG TPA: hypothetical protein PLP27_05260 [Crocinitomicaceae bacterium]|jgi:hypothetical protein|nr:hypothetical protein [Crocinitomicaceae bacterium]